MKSFSTTLLTFLLISITYSAFSQTILREINSQSPTRDGSFGRAILNLGDINQDGKADYAISLDKKDGANISPGLVYFYSGADYSVIDSVESPNPIEDGKFGDNMIQIGDLTNDGIQKILISAHREEVCQGFQNRCFDGRVYIVDPTITSSLFNIDCPAVNRSLYFGQAIAALDQDLDGDGFTEFAVGAERVGGGVVYIYDAHSNTPVDSVFSPHPEANSAFGTAVAPLYADINGNGTNEILIGAPLEGLNTDPSIDFRNEGRVYIYDPGAKQILRMDSALRPDNDARFGTELVGLNQDLTNDGINDYAASAPNELGDGRVYIMNSATGDTISTAKSPRPSLYNNKFGQVLHSLEADLNSDGINELIVSALEETTSIFKTENGNIYFMDPTNGNLLMDFTTSYSQSFGTSLEVIGDIDGNGFNDIAIGDVSASPGTPSFAGIVTIYDSKDTTAVGLKELQLISSNYEVITNAKNIYITPLKEANQNYAASVYNLEGKLIYENLSINGQKIIDLSSTNRGVYIIKIQNQDTVFSRKLYLN